jgi:hypothetical protein
VDADIGVDDIIVASIIPISCLQKGYRQYNFMMIMALQQALWNVPISL